MLIFVSYVVVEKTKKKILFFYFYIYLFPKSYIKLLYLCYYVYISLMRLFLSYQINFLMTLKNYH